MKSVPVASTASAVGLVFTAVLVVALFVGGIGRYAVAKAEASGSALDSTTPARALRWDHEELTAIDATTRASRWDHEERTSDSTTPRASRWDHEER